jgi:tyramine---L-glutamate ligase
MDAVIVIAPELDGTLERILSIMRMAGVKVLAGDSRFIHSACDQWHTCNAWKSTGVRHPETWLLSEFLTERQATQQNGIEHSGAWVVKRRDSAGCVGQRRYRDLDSLFGDVFLSTELASERERWIVQPWIDGIPASLAMMCHEEERWILGCFEQRMESTTEGEATRFGYSGGSGPISGIPLNRLREFAVQALNALPGQPSGWNGIDFIIEPDGSWTAIEVNPRLTSSYLGYRKWYGPELAKSWILGVPPSGLDKEFPRLSFSLANWEG